MIRLPQLFGTPVRTLAVRRTEIPRVEQGFDYHIAGKDTTMLIETGEDIRDAYEESVANR